MAQPVDRVPGVVLVTDYGALDRALEAKARQEAKSTAIQDQIRAHIEEEG